MMYLRTTSFSTNLERIGVTDIGRRSEKVLTAAVLGTGVTRAVFHEEGDGVPVCNTVLKRTVTTGVNSIAQCLKTQYSIESCPGLVFLTEFNNLNTSYSKTGRGAEPLPDTESTARISHTTQKYPSSDSD